MPAPTHLAAAQILDVNEDVPRPSEDSRHRGTVATGTGGVRVQSS